MVAYDMHKKDEKLWTKISYFIKAQNFCETEYSGSKNC